MGGGEDRWLGTVKSGYSHGSYTVAPPRLGAIDLLCCLFLQLCSLLSFLSTLPKLWTGSICAVMLQISDMTRHGQSG